MRCDGLIDHALVALGRLRPLARAKTLGVTWQAQRILVLKSALGTDRHTHALVLGRLAVHAVLHRRT